MSAHHIGDSNNMIEASDPEAGRCAVATGSLCEAIDMERACWETLKVMERQKYPQIKALRAEIDAQREKWAFYYGEVKRLHSANTTVSQCRTPDDKAGRT